MAEYIERMREKVGSERLLMPGTGCIIVDDRERVLLHLRSDGKGWGLPGGTMDIGETVLENLAREIDEELGITLIDPTLFGVFSGPEFDTTYPNGDRLSSVSTLFLATRWSGEPRPSEESHRIEFFPIDNLPDPLNPNDAIILRYYRESREGKRESPIIL